MTKHIEPVWRRQGQGVQILIMAAVFLGSFGLRRSALPAQNTTITGSIRSASDEPVSGALVKVRSAELRLGFMVVSQEQGRYSTPNLPPGKYSIQAFGGDFESDSAGPVVIRNGEQRKMDLVLNTLRKKTPPAEDPIYHRGMTNASYEKLMPEGEGKRLIISRCTICHSLERVVSKRATREVWQKIVDRMHDYLQDHRVPLTDQERDAMLDYVAKNFSSAVAPFRHERGPVPDSNSNLPRTLLTGTAAKFVAMEYYLPRGVWIHHMAVDSHGTAWFSETSAGILGRFDPASLTYTPIAPPAGKFPERFINAVAVDPQDRVWLTDNEPNGLLYQYNPTSKQFTTYEIPAPPGSRPNVNTLRFRDGSVWGTAISFSQIVTLDPKTRKWIQFPVSKGSLPYGLAFGGDNMLWYSAGYDNDVVKLDPSTGMMTHYKAPTPKSGLQQLQADTEGNLWVAESESGKLLKVDYRTGKLAEYEPPTKDSGPFGIDVDMKRELIWFGEMNAGKLGRYDPRGNSFVEFPLPSLPSEDSGVEFSDEKVIWIEVDPSHPNRVWWGAGTNARIGYIEVLE